MHIIQFCQHAFPLQRREGRDEQLAVGEHREQLLTDLLKAFDHVTPPRHLQAIGRHLPGLAAIVRFFDAPIRIHSIGGTYQPGGCLRPTPAPPPPVTTAGERPQSAPTPPPSPTHPPPPRPH